MGYSASFVIIYVKTYAFTTFICNGRGTAEDGGKELLGGDTFTETKRVNLFTLFVAAIIVGAQVCTCGVRAQQKQETKA